MTCPKCGGKQTGVYMTEKETDSIRRYRQCKECGYEFTTVEYEEEILNKISMPKGGFSSD